MTEDAFDTKLKIMLKEWDHIQFHVARFDTLTINLRYWSVVILGGFLAATIAAKEKDILLFAIIPVMLLWLLDAMHKWYQQIFSQRGQDLERFLSSNQFIQIVTARDATMIVSPLMSIPFSQDYKILDKLRPILRAALLANVMLTYVAIIGACILTYLCLLVFWDPTSTGSGVGLIIHR
jgi:uncharacterized membrane protein